MMPATRRWTGGAETQVRASDVIGRTVYGTEAAIEGPESDVDATGWEAVGDVNDILMAADGAVQGKLLDIGGFLGMGERQVMLAADKLKFVSGMNDGEEFYIVFPGTAADFEAMSEFNAEGIYDWTADSEQQTAADPEAETQTEMAQTEPTQSGAVDRETQDIYAAPAPEVALEGWERLELAEVTTEMLTGATVLDANMQDIGTVSELFVGMNGELTEAKLSVGGMIWGIGATDVRVSMDSLHIQQDLQAGDVQVYVDMTEEALMERSNDG